MVGVSWRAEWTWEVSGLYIASPSLQLRPPNSRAGCVPSPSEHASNNWWQWWDTKCRRAPSRIIGLGWICFGAAVVCVGSVCGLCYAVILYFSGFGG